MPPATKKRVRSPDPVDVFFEGLASRGHEPMLHSAAGSVRFDLTRGKRVEQVLVTLDRGDVVVSRRVARADAVVHVDRSLFTRLVEGRANLVTSLLRGLATLEGDLGIVALFTRVFPGPPDSVSSFRDRRAKEGSDG